MPALLGQLCLSHFVMPLSKMSRRKTMGFQSLACVGSDAGTN